MHKTIIPWIVISLSVIVGSSCVADDGKSAESATQASETATAEKHVHTWTTDEPWVDVKENIELAITDLGLIVSGALHISDMMNRTGKDLGFEQEVFKHAEAVEFCSAPLSHKMAVVHPANVSICPFTIVVYEKNDSPGTVHVGFRNIRLLGDGAAVEKEIYDTLEGIVKEAVE